MSSSIPINKSIVEISPSTWRLGCTVVCDRTTEPIDSCAAAWKDGEYWYTLRLVSSQPTDLVSTDSQEVRLIHEGGSLSAVWSIGNNTICKIHHCSPDTTSESETIKFIQEKAPRVPVSAVIYSWVEGDRSFLVLKKIPGITLRDAWGTMSDTQQEAILDDIVRICDILASITSDRLQNVCGGPVLEPYLAHSDRESLEPLTVSESKRYLFSENVHSNPEVGERFHLYHPDLGPGNILVSNQKLSAVIDWECAGFYPGFWISTKPSVSPGLNFCPPIPGVDEIEWRKRLRTKLEERGYPRFAEWFMEWRETKFR